VQYSFIHKDAIFIKELTAKFMMSRGFGLICEPKAHAPLAQKLSE
jgi:hypothetical protein